MKEGVGQLECGQSDLVVWVREQVENGEPVGAGGGLGEEGVPTRPQTADGFDG